MSRPPAAKATAGRALPRLPIEEPTERRYRAAGLLVRFAGALTGEAGSWCFLPCLSITSRGADAEKLKLQRSPRFFLPGGCCLADRKVLGLLGEGHDQWVCTNVAQKRSRHAQHKLNKNRCLKIKISHRYARSFMFHYRSLRLVWTCLGQHEQEDRANN